MTADEARDGLLADSAAAVVLVADMACAHTETQPYRDELLAALDVGGMVACPTCGLVFRERAMTVAERTRVERYLQAYWRMEANGPCD